jgi:hypothetical protein
VALNLPTLSVDALIERALVNTSRHLGTNPNLDPDESVMAGPDSERQSTSIARDGSALTQVASMTNVCLANPILYCCFENVDFYVC